MTNLMKNKTLACTGRTVALIVLTALASVACSGSEATDPLATAGAEGTSQAGGQSSTSGAATVGDDRGFEIPEEIGERTVEKLGGSRENVRFNDPVPIGTSGCFLQTTYSVESTAVALYFGVLGNGDVLEGGEPGAVAALLESCAFGAGTEITADEWAELMVRIDEKPGPIRVMQEGDSFMAEDLGLTWSAPQMTTDGDERSLRFLAFGTDFFEVYEVNATRTADGQFSSTYVELTAP